MAEERFEQVSERLRVYGKKGVFAAGDIVHRPKTVVMAMREGKKVALSAIAYMKANKSAE